MRTVAAERESVNIIGASAPGKLLIAGEYAVLEGAPALVIAVNRRARVEIQAPSLATPDPLSPLHLAIGEALNLGADELHRLHFDTSALFHDARKLGLGSSAAACVAGVAALSPAKTRLDSLFELSKLAHRGFQSGLGSGFDVAASLYGGVLAYEQDKLPDRLNLPHDLHLAAFAWNKSASTTHQIEAWRRVRDMGPFLDSATRIRAAAHSSAEALLASIAEFQARLMRLDRRFRLGIATAQQLRLQTRADALAKKHGAELLFKQSGAGGGDLAIALSNSTQALQDFVAIAVQSGLMPLNIELEMQGLSRE